jgi:hypothetical protein
MHTKSFNIKGNYEHTRLKTMAGAIAKYMLLFMLVFGLKLVFELYLYLNKEDKGIDPIIRTVASLSFMFI